MTGSCSFVGGRFPKSQLDDYTYFGHHRPLTSFESEGDMPSQKKTRYLFESLGAGFRPSWKRLLIPALPHDAP
jgi:hypothetical protein